MGSYDTLYQYAGGGDPGFVERELSPASIVRDVQRAIVIALSGWWLNQQPPTQMNLAITTAKDWTLTY